MASTFSELFSDYQDALKQYTEKLDVTPLSFMRNYTKAMQVFQRETEYLEAWATVPVTATSGNFDVPNDMQRLAEVMDSDANTILMLSYEEWRRALELDETGFRELPVDYSMRLAEEARIACIWNRVLMLYPDNGDLTVTMHYIPDLHPISQNSIQWATWYPIDTNFDTQFRQAAVTPTLAPYEDAFLQYAIALFLKSQGVAEQAARYEGEFKSEIERGKLNKPLYYHEGTRPYMMAPYS